jgi:hypothetical protein
MIGHFASLFGGDRERGSDYAARRLGMLIATSDLSMIEMAQFDLLCRVCNGLATTERADAKATLLDYIHGAVLEEEEIWKACSDRRFAHGRASARARVMWGIAAEKQRLLALMALIDKLDAGTCVALLARIEEVLAGRGDDLSGRCASVDGKMQSRQQL